MHMRPIEAQEIRNKRIKRNQLLIGIVLIGLMVLSSAGYALVNSFSSSTQTEQSKYGLSYTGSYWTGVVAGNNITLTLDPDEAATIPVDLGGITLSSYDSQTLYVASDGPFSFNQIAINLGPFVSSVREACFGPCEKNLPEKSCNDSLIVINSSATESKVYRKENCLFIDGNSDSTEAMLYHILGVLP